MNLARKDGWLIPAMFLVLTTLLCVAFSIAQVTTPQVNMETDNSPLQSGYAVVTPTSVATSGLVVFETFGERQVNGLTQAGVLPADMTTNTMLFVSANGRMAKNLGVAIANPGSTTANITLTLRDDMGAVLSTVHLAVDAHAQITKFVTDLFDGQPNMPGNLTGTLQIASDVPVAVVGLRFRGANFSTLPATNLSASSPVPVISAGVGGAAAIILPQFATGGGWATEIVLANTGPADLTVRIDLFAQDGKPLTATLNGTSASSFTGITIPKGGVVILARMIADDDDGF